MTSEFSLNWELDSLAPHPETEPFRSLFDSYASDLKQLAEDTESLPPFGDRESAAGWANLLGRYADLHARTEDLHAFVGCHAAADAENRHFQQIEGELSALLPHLQQILTNLELGCSDASDDELSAFAGADETLAQNVFFLQECRRNGAFSSSQGSGTLLAADLDVDGLRAWSRLYDRLSGELRVEVMEQGEVVRKSPGQGLLGRPASERCGRTISSPP